MDIKNGGEGRKDLEKKKKKKKRKKEKIMTLKNRGHIPVFLHPPFFSSFFSSSRPPNHLNQHLKTMVVSFEELFVQVTFFDDESTAVVAGHDLRSLNSNPLTREDLKEGTIVSAYWQGDHAWLRAVVHLVSGECRFFSFSVPKAKY